ncbi:hypothetical protein MIND_00836300 [Mycena indigotica]|uniref:Telomere-associated protein Rif1 N-terminal domain-containing protein n=1 Tax=Mycena indigotica TaxID=2126181 RepID=A0A8H6SH61_9AGAR|nr:uncharacterized protein MIND_00836300 [Mycena indigotica]KAF7298883.1 hypothetical protein MIND_00836300 [Mycena indigotica]
MGGEPTSLPTPPSTGHRAKENRAPRWHVNWSPQNQYRTFTNDDLLTTSASKSTPSKSILKKPTELLLPLIDASQRESTPEPSRPETDPNYLSSAVQTLADSDASLDDLIRAYSVLTARLRAHITFNSDTKCALLSPLRKHRTAVTEAIIRDLARCAVDPDTMEMSAEDIEEEEHIKEQRQPLHLPSPKSSPKKKRGTTAKKARYGRDLCTTCHSALKLLAVVFTLPAVFNIFNNAELSAILTEVLGIPLADQLPTPNSRKTYALSIWLLQTQRLPPSVLDGAADRIAHAIGRGIDGELGKEGKKGSASDGLKAIHDLCVYQPAIFVPKFEPLLPSMLTNLLASTLSLRTQACHALGGFARGLTTLPVSSLQSRISAAVVAHLTAPPPPSKSPTKSNEAAIVRTLRITLAATEVQNVAQGPVWALTTIAALLVLANSEAYAHDGARKVFCALLPLAVKHKKSSIRTLACTVWRCATWAYCQPLLPESDDFEPENKGGRRKLAKIEESRMELWTRLLQGMVDMGVGISTIAALLAETEHDMEENIGLAAGILKSMTIPGKNNHLPDAIDILARMVSYEAREMPWSWDKLLPRGLLSASPGLLTAEYTSLEAPVRTVLAQCPAVDDVRPLDREELAQSGTFDKLLGVWKECIACIGLRDDEPVLPNIVHIWHQLLKIHISAAKEKDDSDTNDCAVFAVEALVEILDDHNIDLTMKHRQVPCTDGPEPKNDMSNAALKIRLLRALWGATRQAFGASQLAGAAEKLLFTLMQGEDEFTDCGDVSRTEWATFCAEVSIVCDPDVILQFWKYDGADNSKWEWTREIRRTVWRCFATLWKEDKDGTWPAINYLLAVPFSTQQDCDLEGADLDLWEALLERGIDKALDYGFDVIAVLDHAASTLARDRSPTASGAARVADVLLSRLIRDDEFRELPDSLFELVNDILKSCYPPERRIRQQTLWTIRTVSRTIEFCPIEYVVDMLRSLQGGLCMWLSDEQQALSNEDYVYDMVNIYEVFLLKIRTLPRELDVLASTATIFVAPFTGREKHATGVGAAFLDFWKETYASDFPEPDQWPEEIEECLAAVGLTSRPATPARSVSPTPATPSSRFSDISTPPRPRKLPSTIHDSPESPVRVSYSLSSPSTPKRTPLRSVPGSQTSPHKRRRLDQGDKENESPVFVASFMDRLSSKKSMPSGGEDRSHKRRRLLDGSVEPVGILMTPRSLFGNEDEEEERVVAASLVRQEQGQDLQSSSRSNKRKRAVMEVVIVPPKSSSSTYNRARQNNLDVEVRSTAKVVRRGPSFSRKRSREDFDDSSSDDPFSDNPHTKSSSDDDPYLGQVTPSHVVSPVIRRKRQDDPPSSDDSVSSGSPVKGMVARRLQRVGSNGRVGVC